MNSDRISPDQITPSTGSTTTELEEPDFEPDDKPAAPKELLQLRQWVCWKREVRDGKPTKVPYSPNGSGQRAKSNDAKTWGSYDDAVAASKNFDGMGFEITPPFVGIDLDGCRNPGTGELESWAAEIVRLLDSYTEITPSKKGLHIWVKGTIPGSHRKKGGIEMYGEGRYFTVTGQRLPDRPLEIMERDLTAAYVFGFGSEKFRDLWLGNWQAHGYPSQSEADLALCSLLAKEIGPDALKIDALFRLSHLNREKWDYRRGGGTYGENTIQKALANPNGSGPHDGFSCSGGSPPCADGQAPPSCGTSTVTSLVEPSATSTEDGSKKNSLIEFPKTAMIGLAAEFAQLYAEYVEAPAEAFYAAYLTALGSAISKKARLNTTLNVQPRLYTVLLGESDIAKKSTAIHHTNQFFQDVNVLNEFFSPVYGLGSAEGIARALSEKKQPLLLCFDELKTFVDKTKQEGSVGLPMVTSLFEQNQWDNWTATKTISVRDAHLSLIAACTTQTYSSMWTPQYLDIGFINRLFIVLCARTRKVAFPRPIPQEVRRDFIRRTREQIAAIVKAENQTVFDIDGDGLKLWEDWYSSLEDSIYARRLDTIGMRLMILLAVTTQSKSITRQIVSAVIEIQNYELRVRRLTDPVDAENSTAKLEEKIRRYLVERPMGRRELSKRIHAERYGIWAFNMALKNLQDNGEVGFDKFSKCFFLRPSRG